MDIGELKKKQDEEFDKYFYEGINNAVFCWEHKLYATPTEIKKFIDKVRSETAEAVARSMVGGQWKQSDKEESGFKLGWRSGYNFRVEEEQATLEEIIKSNIKK